MTQHQRILIKMGGKTLFRLMVKRVILILRGAVVQLVAVRSQTRPLVQLY